MIDATEAGKLACRAVAVTCKPGYEARLNGVQRDKKRPECWLVAVALYTRDGAPIDGNVFVRVNEVTGSTELLE